MTIRKAAQQRPSSAFSALIKRTAPLAFSLLLALIFLVAPLRAQNNPAESEPSQPAAALPAAQPDQEDQPEDAAARSLLEQTWQRAKESGAYEFNADINQIERPLASVLNVGRQSKRDKLYLQGSTNLEESLLQMTLWMNGGSVQDEQTGTQVRVEGDNAFVRQGTQPWQEANNFTGLFAPQNDFMTYLVAAANVQNEGQETRAGLSFTRLSFIIDGAAYAGYMRDQMQAELQARGELPAGTTLTASPLYSGMKGTGELWIGEDGLPLRQILRLEFAPQDDAQISAEVTVNFKNFNPLPVPTVANNAFPASVLDSMAPIINGSITPQKIVNAASEATTSSLPFLLGLGLMGLLFVALVRARRSHAVMATILLTLVFSMLFSPLLQSVHASTVYDRFKARTADEDARAEKSDMAKDIDTANSRETAAARGTLDDILNDPGTDSDGDGYSDVEEQFLGTNALQGTGRDNKLHSFTTLTTNTPNQDLPANDGTDTDGDGLTDYVEALLGTLATTSDTDGDLISDYDELTGFTAYGQTWTTDPSELDTNHDGIGDGQEWTLNAVNGIPADSDNDNIPDLFDDDNDGDGVPDNLDLSPYTRYQTPFTQDQPFSLILNDLTPDKITYVEFQLRPTDPEHLWYAFNALDWPEDREGNIQDADGGTFPQNTNGDMQLIPMLEVTVPAGSENLLPLDLLDNYSIAVQELPGDGKALYVPLQLVTTDQGAENVAFAGKMIYEGTGDWNDENQVRLVWIVQALNDVCASFGDDGLCETYEEYNRPQVIHTYHDDWYLTGLNVRENFETEIATVYEDPAVDEDLSDDLALWQLSYGLDLSFLAGGQVTGTLGTRLWDVQEIAARFDHNANDSNGVTLEQRWNISDTLSVATASYTHLDEAIMTTVQTTTVAILDANFTSSWSAANPISPTLLFARQDEYRNFNLDNRLDIANDVIGWEDQKLTLNLSGTAVPVEIASTMSWAPYMYEGGEWQAYPIERYWEYLGETLAGGMAQEFPNPEEAGGGLLLAQLYYVRLMGGVSNIVQIAEQRLQQSFFASDKPLGAGIAGGFRSSGVFILRKVLEAKLAEASLMLTMLFKEVSDAGKYAAANPIGAAAGKAKNLFNSIRSLSRINRGLAFIGTLLIVGAVILGIRFLVATAFSEEALGPARITTAVIVGAVIAYGGVISPLLQIKAMAGLYQAIDFGYLSATAAWLKAAKSAESVTRGTKITAAVGLVISIGIAWGIFIYAATSSNISAGSVAFHTLLAQTIGATILAIIQFALSLSLVGAIIVAIFGIVDLLLFLLGVNFSINGWVIEQIGKLLYHFELTIDSDIDTGSPDLTLNNPNSGLVNGAIMAATMPITTTITHKNPSDSRALLYLNKFYTPDILKSTTFKYTLSPDKAPFSVGRHQMLGGWEPVVTDHTFLGKDMSRGTNIATPTTNVTLNTGINEPIALYLNNSYALPGFECWTILFIPDCDLKNIVGNGSSDIGSYIVFDVLPETLDEFIDLDWGGNIPFETQQDYDNDGLRSTALNGNDPDDFDWDTDDDHLSDAYELRMRENGTALTPLNRDSDGDGLSDFDEMRFGTNPAVPDTDRDGLLDSDEVWHLDPSSGEWKGGWDFTAIYTDTNDVINQTLTVRIFSDPLKSDADNDGLTDGVEKALHLQDPAAYPFHPNVFNENPVALYLAFSDEDGFVGLDQTLTVSATVQNNLSSPLYAMGDFGLTLPSELGSLDLVQEFNIFQGQSSSIVTPATVDNAAANGLISITADYFTRLHDGDLSWSYAWLPSSSASGAASAGNDRILSASVAANPASPNGNDYAIASLNVNSATSLYSNLGILTEGGASASPASTTVGQAVDINEVNSDPYFNKKIGMYGTDIACNDQGKCAEAYVDVAWEECPDVYFDYMHVTKESDDGAQGEYGIKHVRPVGVFNTLFWGWTSGGNGANLPIDISRQFCPGDYFDVWEEDPSPNPDDFLGKEIPDLAGPHDTSQRFLNGDDVTVYYSVNPNTDNFYGALRLLDTNLAPDTAQAQDFLRVSDYGMMANPALATSGSRWLVGFDGYYNKNLYLVSVDNSGQGYNGLQLTTDNVSHDLDLVWAGNQFLAVWEYDHSPNDHDIKMALVDSSGSVTDYRGVDRFSSDDRLPAVAYSPLQDQSLVVYTSGSKIVGRFIQGISIGYRFDIATLPAGRNFRYGPKVAYDAANNVWIVSYLSAIGSTDVLVNYLSLAPGTLDRGTTPLTAVQTLSGIRYQDLACNNAANQDPNAVIRSTCAIVSSDDYWVNTPTFRMDTITFESTPPWIGGGGGLTNSETKFLIVDRDVPTSTVTSFTSGATAAVSDTFVFGGEANDPTSNIALVEVNIDNTGWQPAEGLNSWSYSWNVPPADGQHTIQTRATDVVGNVGNVTSTSVILDHGAPATSINGTPDQFVTATQDVDGRFHISFSGTATDALGSVAAVEAAISPTGNGWQAATLNGSNWTVDYVLPEIDENSQRVTNPTGSFTLKVRARDDQGNVSQDGSYSTLAFKLDTTPPTAVLTGYGPSYGFINDTIALSGVMTDTGSVSSGLQQLDIDFVPIDQTTNTWTPVTLAGSGPGISTTTWTHQVPSGLEGNYLINLRGTDGQGNKNSEGSWWTNWQGEIDTRAPEVPLFTAVQRGAGTAAKTHYEAIITDLNLTEAGIEFPCAIQRQDRGYANNATPDSFGPGQAQLISLTPQCTINGFDPNPVTLRVFDEFGHETEVTINPTPLTTNALGGPSVRSSAPLSPPALASTILTPTDGSVITTLTDQNVEGGAYAHNGLKTLTMTINGIEAYTTSWDATPVITDTLWQTVWTPPAEGVYELFTVVEDWSGGVQTELQPVTAVVNTTPPLTPTVDTTPPVLLLDNSVQTQTQQLSLGRSQVGGTAIDTNLQSVSLASTVLTPTDDSVLTTLAQQNIEGGAYALNGLKTLTMTINGTEVYTTSWPETPATTDTLWQTTWTPPAEGIDELVTVVEDWTGGIQTELQPVTVTVDTTTPVLTLDNDVLTQTQQLSLGRFELGGTAIDTNLQSVTIAFDGGTPMAADLSDPNWGLVWAPPSGTPPAPAQPDGETYSAVITAYDGGNTTTINTTLTVDAVSPQDMTVTTSTAGGTPVSVSAGDTVRDPAVTGLTTAWTVAADGSGVAGYQVGWTNSPTPTLSALNAYPDATASHTTAVTEASLNFAHTAALDTLGNTLIESLGPVVIDAPTTPDYINPADGLGGVYRGWMDSGCSLVGADYEVARYAPDGSSLNSVQKFYTSWDANYLRLAWTGADWEVDGDLFIYLDTSGGGTTSAYNPYGAGAAITLPDEGSGPMAADYLIFVEDGSAAELYHWSSGWVLDQTLTAPNFLFDPNSDEEKTDLYLPFNWLGSPSSLKLVALASDEESLRLWAAMPDHNPLNSERAVNPVALSALDLPFGLTQSYEWANAGSSGVCPAAGQFQNSDLHFELTAEPAGVAVGFLQHDLQGLLAPNAALDADLDGTPDMLLPLDVDSVPLGLGQTINYTLHYANDGTEPAAGVVAYVSVAGGVDSLSSASIPLPPIPAGSSGTVQFSAAINPALDGESAELKVEIVDAVHAPFDWLWMQHDIDSVGPTDVQVISPIVYIGANLTTLIGEATDESGVPEITLRVDGSTTQSCPDATPKDGQWSCIFDAGGAADSRTFQFDARGTDQWGNSGSYGPAVTLVVDTNAPSISLNAASTTKLADNVLTGTEIVLSGSVTDDRTASAAEICALLDGETEPLCIQVPVNPGGQAAGDWITNVPIADTADGENYTLTFFGIDSAGNRTGTPLSYNIVADFSGPAVQITTKPTVVSQYSTVTALAGTIADNSGVASHILQITRPDNNNFVADELQTVDLGTGANWSRSLTFDRLGIYQLGLIAVDTVGNESILGTFKIETIEAEINVPPTADAGGPYEVNEGETLTLAGVAADINQSSGLEVSWDLDGDGNYEIVGILDPVFDATNINGPAQQTISFQVFDGEFTTTDSTTISIRNVLPTADAGGPYEVDEGGLLTVTGSGSDPFDAVVLAWDLDEDGVYDDATGTTAVFDATEIDGFTLGSVSLQVTDDDGGVITATSVITINNVIPELDNIAALSISENSIATLSGDIIDPAILDYFDMEIVWGDGRSSSATITPTTAEAESIDDITGAAAANQLLRLDIEALGEAGMQHRFENGLLDSWVSRNWSSYDGLSFWLYGTGSGTTLFVELYDNRNPGSTTDDAQRWRYEFSDTTGGWQQVSVLFADFEDAENSNGAPDDDLGLTEVWGWAVGAATTNGLETRYVDDVSLFTAATTTIIDDFENGLPSGSDSNGITVGFSTRSDANGVTQYFDYPAGTTSFSETHLFIDDDDDDSFPITLRIRDDDDETFNSFSTTIAVSNVAPAVSISAAQTTQYSDGIAPIVISATDVISDPLEINTSWQLNGGSVTAGLMAGQTLTDNGCIDNGDYTQTCTWTVAGIADVAAGDYLISAELNDDDGGVATVSTHVLVTPEDATLRFDADNPVAVEVDAPESNASQPFDLIITVEESELDAAAYLAAAGDINLAQVSMILEPVGPGGPVEGICAPDPVSPVSGYDDILTVACSFDDVPVNTYTVTLIVGGGYYSGTNEDVIVIYDPSLGFTTGGGWFYWPGSAQPQFGYLGDKTNFGYTMKYNKPLTNIQGNLLLIRHMPDGEIYRLKSNAIEGLSLGDTGSFGWASFTGKGTYKEPGWLDPSGNYKFVLYVEDHNEPGSGIDKVWLETRDKDELVVPAMSMARPGSDHRVAIVSGNIVVPHSGGTENQSPTADFSYMADGLSVDFTDNSSDPDGQVTAWQWDFGDGSTDNSQNPSHSYAAAGSYDVTLTVTDGDDNTDTLTQEITITDGSVTEMYVEELRPSSAWNGNKWEADVTILILDTSGNPVSNAQVSGAWSGGASGASSCPTDNQGYCTVTKTNINANRASVTFTVNNVTHAALTYNATLNNWTSIEVDRPN